MWADGVGNRYRYSKDGSIVIDSLGGKWDIIYAHSRRFKIIYVDKKQY